MPLHVLQLGPYPPPEGGITRNILAIRDELHRRGHRCSIVATSKSSQTRNEPDVYHPRSAAALLRLLRTLEYDVLHLHVGGDIGKRVMSLAAACSIFGGKRKVLTIHSGAYPLTNKARNAVPKSVPARIFRRFSKLIGVNEAIADVFRRSGVPDGSISVIPPVALRRPDAGVAMPPKIDAFRTTHSPLLLSVGGMEPDYDPLLQVGAMREIRRQFPDAGLLMVGDGAMQSEVQSEIMRSGHPDHIMLAGNLEHAVTLRLIDEADALLRTTLFDGDAISVREALYLGTPVIATDTGKRPDGVQIIPVGDKNALASAAKRVLSGKAAAVAASAPDNSNIEAVVGLYEELAS